MAKFDWEKHNLYKHANYINKYKFQDVTENTVLWFGKYRGMKIREVMRKDPRYIEWCKDKNIFSRIS